MMVTVKLPATTFFGVPKVTATLVSVGDDVVADTPLFEIEDEKAVMEIPSGFTGRVTELFVAIGDPVDCGMELLVLDVQDRQC